VDAHGNSGIPDGIRSTHISSDGFMGVRILLAGKFLQGFCIFEAKSARVALDHAQNGLFDLSAADPLQVKSGFSKIAQKKQQR
jgi:hypothetical protein